MKLLSWVATFTSVMMYVSYFPTVWTLASVTKGTLFNRFAAINFLVFGSTGGLSKERDIPLCCSHCRDHLWFDHSHHTAL